MTPSLGDPTRFLFFTGKGGVGKTSTAAATALGLARGGRRVLIVSTDPASNLDTVLETELGMSPTPVTGVEGLHGMNLDPEEAARNYRERVVGPYRGVLPDSSVASIEEQLSGACTVEVAAFDEFAGLLAGSETAEPFDHIVFDTAPTGHTLRLLQLPAAWTTFIDENERGASCLGPLSGLKNQQKRYEAALSALSDPERTTLVLVTRPEEGALQEAERTRVELAAQGLKNQLLVVNGRFRPTSAGDPLADRIASVGEAALDGMPAALRALPRVEIALKPHNVVGLEALESFFADEAGPDPAPWGDPQGTAAALTSAPSDAFPGLDVLADEVAADGHGLVMFMGKGGVGKTTLATALAVELAARGLPVHLTTTDPAAHVEHTLRGAVEGLRVTRIDPKAETEAYRRKVVDRSRNSLDAEGLALLEEDLESPCTEEVAVFHAFSRVVFSAKREIVVMDTAPTGHTLLLLDAAGSYHREMLRNARGGTRLATPLMYLQDTDHTRIVLVTLAETTPVQEAAQLQEDLRRADIEPHAWLVNRSLAASTTSDPVLQARARAEAEEMKAIREQHARRLFVVPWSAEAPRGTRRLQALAGAR
ncbi:MAG: arsenical pump-driving ATPase [Gemmatimonadetes bacterium]|nr:arsenical pump-driving ATPase [Gemmatimonadota bacterium]